MVVTSIVVLAALVVFGSFGISFSVRAGVQASASAAKSAITAANATVLSANYQGLGVWELQKSIQKHERER